jgi:hypothetical protein
MTPRRIERWVSRLGATLCIGAFVAACANAAPGTSSLSTHDAGVGDLALAIGDGPGTDMAHHVGAGVSPTGAWVQVASPADALGSALNSQMPMMTIYGGQPAITWIEGSDTRVATWKSNAWSLLGGALNAFSGHSTLEPQLAARGSTLDVAFLEQTSATVTTNSIHVYSWASSTWSTVGAPVAVQLTFLEDLALALTPAGLPVVGWTQQINGSATTASNVYVDKFDGSAWSAYGPSFEAESGTSAGTGALQPNLAIDSAGTLYATWQETFVHVYTDSSAWTPVGPNLGEVVGVSGATGSWEQAITLDSMQRPIVAVTEYDGPDLGLGDNLYVKRYASGAWSLLNTAPLTAPGATNLPERGGLAVDSTDAPIIGWLQNDASKETKVYAARIDNGAVTLLGQPLTVPTGFQYPGLPVLVVDEDDIPTLIFTGQSTTDSTYRLFVYRYAPS